MIVSHSHRFIFLKTRKTAGTSVEISLSRYCDGLDIVTPVTAEDEVSRLSAGGGVARNFALTRLPIPENDDEASWEPHFKQTAGKLQVQHRLANHTPAVLARQVVGERIWNSYLKFTIERDPVQQLLSLYFWRKSDGRWKGSFEEFLDSGIPQADRNSGIYMMGSELAADVVIDHARLGDDLAKVCKALAIPFDGWLPRLKSGVRRDEDIEITDGLRKRIESDFDLELDTYRRAASGEFLNRLTSAG